MVDKARTYRSYTCVITKGISRKASLKLLLCCCLLADLFRIIIDLKNQ